MCVYIYMYVCTNANTQKKISDLFKRKKGGVTGKKPCGDSSSASSRKRRFEPRKLWPANFRISFFSVEFWVAKNVGKRKKVTRSPFRTVDGNQKSGEKTSWGS